MCSTEMTETCTMSPSTITSSSRKSGCLSSPVNRRSPSRTPPRRAVEVPDDEDEISVGCPSPLPLVVATPHQEDEEERYSPSREVYSERLSPRSYQEEIEDEERYSREVEYRMSSGAARLSEGRVLERDVTTLREDDRIVAPTTGGPDDYFKPLKKLKMVQIQQSDEEDDRERDASERGVKSFSILDILSHRPKAKIVRPWDTVESNHSHLSHHHHHHHHHHSGPRDLSLVGMSLASMSGSMSEPPLSSSSSSGRSSVSDSGSPDPLTHHHHALHHGMHPGLHHHIQQFKRKIPQQHGSQGGQNTKRSPGQGSPLDALFQMTSKTFDAGEHSQGDYKTLAMIFLSSFFFFILFEDKVYRYSFTYYIIVETRLRSNDAENFWQWGIMIHTEEIRLM